MVVVEDGVRGVVVVVVGGMFRNQPFHFYDTLPQEDPHMAVGPSKSTLRLTSQ